MLQWGALPSPGTFSGTSRIELGAACLDYQDRTLRNLSGCKRAQVDECWAFCYAKAKNVTPEIAAKNPFAGDVWTWASIDADTKADSLLDHRAA